MSRIFDRTLDCGCLVSSDGGGGLIPCHYGYGCGKNNCDVNNECDSCIKQAKRCVKVWKAWKKTDDYKQHKKELKELNK